MLLSAADQDFSALRNTTQSVFCPQSEHFQALRTAGARRIYCKDKTGYFQLLQTLKYLGKVIAKTIIKPKSINLSTPILEFSFSFTIITLKKVVPPDYFVSFLKWDKQMMVVSRLGSKTNNLYSQPETIIYLGYTHYKYSYIALAWQQPGP